MGQSVEDNPRAGGAPADWLRLAQAHAAAQRPEAALAACGRGLAMAPGDPALLCVEAAVLITLGRTEPARASYRAALASEPERFEAAFGLALLAAEAGDLKDAQAQLARLRARHPDRPDLKWLSARTAMSLGRPADALPVLEPLARDRRLAPDQQAEVLLLLGDALDALGHYPEAFAAAVRGKAVQRRLFAQHAAGREGAAERFRRLRAWFEACDPAPWTSAPAPRPSPAAGHVVLIGFPCSGATLLADALAGHPGVAMAEAAPALAAAQAEFLSDAAGLKRLAKLSRAEAQAWRARYWEAVAARGVDVGGKLFIDQAPAAAEALPLVARLFPEARVLFAVRDPRDVVLSCLRQAFQMNDLAYAFTDLTAAAQAYDASMALAHACRRLVPLPVLEVRHEALVEDFEGGLRRVCDFLGLAFDPAMSGVAGTAAAQVTGLGAPPLREGLDGRGLGRWRAYQAELAPVLPVLAPWVEQFGYQDA